MSNRFNAQIRNNLVDSLDWYLRDALFSDGLYYYYFYIRLHDVDAERCRALAHHQDTHYSGKRSDLFL